MKKEPLPLFSSPGAAAAAAAANTMTTSPTASSSSENTHNRALYNAHHFYDENNVFKSPMIVQQQRSANQPVLSRRASVDFLRQDMDDPFLGGQTEAKDDSSMSFGHRRTSRAGAPGDHRGSITEGPANFVPTSPSHAVSPVVTGGETEAIITQNWAFSRRGSTTSDSHAHQMPQQQNTISPSPTNTASPKASPANNPTSKLIWSKATSPNTTSSSPAPPPGITSLPNPAMANSSANSSRRTSHTVPKSVGFAAINDHSAGEAQKTMASIVAGSSNAPSSKSSASSSPVETYASPPPMSAAVRAMQPLYSQHFNPRRSRSISGQGAFTERDFIRRPSLPIGLMSAASQEEDFSSDNGGDDTASVASQPAPIPSFASAAASNQSYNHFPSLASTLSGGNSKSNPNHHGLTPSEARVDFALLEGGSISYF